MAPRWAIDEISPDVNQTPCVEYQTQDDFSFDTLKYLSLNNNGVLFAYIEKDLNNKMLYEF